MALRVTLPSQIPASPFYVTLTDTFMTGWEAVAAENLTIRLIFPCESLKEAIGVRAYAESRTDTTNVRICHAKPQIQHHQFAKLMTRENAAAWYRQGELGWREIEPNETRARKCTACKTWVHFPDRLIACGKSYGRLGVRLCGECSSAEWEPTTSADDSPNLRKCRACGERSRLTARVDGWNSLCPECIVNVGGTILNTPSVGGAS